MAALVDLSPHCAVCRYGNWPASHPALTIVPEFLSNIGNSAWWNISTTYYDNSAVGGAKVSPTVAFVKSVSVPAQQRQRAPSYDGMSGVKRRDVL